MIKTRTGRAVRQLQSQTKDRDRDLQELRERLQMGLKLGGLIQAKAIGQAWLEMTTAPEIHQWLEQIVRELNIEIDRPRLIAEKECRDRLKKQLGFLNHLHKAEIRDLFQEGLAADRVISESLGLTTPWHRQLEQERQCRHEELKRKRIEQEQARRNGEHVHGRWLISR